MNQKRGQWHLLTGLILGVLIGIALTSWVFPVRYFDTDPSTLRIRDREQFRELVARTYLVEADTNRALVRIALLKDANSSSALIAQAQKILASNAEDLAARGMALLGAAVNQPSLLITPISTATGGLPTGVVLQFSPTAAPPTATLTPVPIATRTPNATFTPRPTATPQPTLGAPFVLLDQKTVCEPLPVTPLIEIEVKDASGAPVPGVKIQISQLNGGSETFYTGLYPEINAGYANYAMLTGMEYALRVGEAGQLVSGLSIPACEKSPSGTAPGSLFLEFQQP